MNRVSDNRIELSQNPSKVTKKGSAVILKPRGAHSNLISNSFAENINLPVNEEERNPQIQKFSTHNAQKYLRNNTARGIGTLNPKKVKSMNWKIKNQEFGKYGVGVYLFFDLLKGLTITFGWMSLIAIIPVIVNLRGGNIKAGEARFHLERSTLGNSDGSKTSFILCTFCDILYSLIFWGFVFR